MDFLNYLAASVVSSGLLLAAAAYVFQATFSRTLDKRMELFKQQLALETRAGELALKSQIEFRERQIGEFYGPIYARLKRGEPIHKLWTRGMLVEIDATIRELAVESNNAITDIILQKSHLIDGEEFPDTFARYLTHVAVWHGYLQTEHKGVPLDKKAFPEAYYPDEFEREIFDTTERLRFELFELHKRHGLLSRQA